jgi:predicted permease
MTTIAGRVQSIYGTPPEGLKVTLSPVTKMHPAAGEEGLPAALLIMVVTSLILALCCVNVASLMLARAAVRQKEFAIRLAIGGTRRRLIQQLLTESVLVSLVGGVVGLMLTLWITYTLLAFLPSGEASFIDNVEIDKTVLGFSVLISLAAGVAFGLAPAINASKPNVLRSLKDEAMSSGGGKSKMSLRRVLIAAQIAVSLVLLISAGLFVRSLQYGQALSSDFTGNEILLLSLNPKSYGFRIKYGNEFYRQVADRVGSLPGVRSATLSNALPLSLDQNSTSITLEGEEESRTVSQAVVGTRYFETLSIPLVRGRDFTPNDNESAPKVAVVNETMARTYWSGHDPTGKRFHFGNSAELYEVVGVAQDSQYTTFGKPPRPYFYVPIYQRSKEDITLIVRTSGEPLALVPALKREIKDLGGELPIFDFKTLGDVSKLQLIPVQAAATLLGVLGAIGLTVAAIGIYGVTTYSFNQRRHEIGIRLALGAQRSQVLKLILKEGLGLALVGIAAGLLIAIGTTHFVSSLLYGVSPIDPTTFAAVSAILGAVALVASFIPARRAARMNPMDAMRYE